MIEIHLTYAQLEQEIRMAYIHGLGNGQNLEAGLESDETDAYVRSRMSKIKDHNNEAGNINPNT